VLARTRNAILRRVEGIVAKHGRLETYAVLRRWCEREQERNKYAAEADRLKQRLAEAMRKAV
jgi:hypothetical protein